MPFPTRPHALFLTAAHAVALWAIVTSASPIAVAAVLAMHVLFGCFGITLGYHRLLTHRSFSVPAWLERSFAILGALALQGDPIEWVTIHRAHHKSSDREGDPHDASRGFWFAHAGWIDRHYFPHVSPERLERFAPDLLAQPFYRWLRRLYLPLVLGWIGLCWAVAGMPGILWGLFVRLVFTDHMTWFVNSAGHTFGYRAFATDDLSTNCAWTALVSFGEGWHNNHHAYPASARHGFTAAEPDFTFAAIRVLESAGLARAVRLPPPGAIDAARAPATWRERLGLCRPIGEAAESAAPRVPLPMEEEAA